VCKKGARYQKKWEKGQGKSLGERKSNTRAGWSGETVEGGSRCFEIKRSGKKKRGGTGGKRGGT